MAKQTINVGTTANDRKGDSLRAAFQKVNANFTELYTQLGLINDPILNLGAFEFNGSTITTTDSTLVTIDQATIVTSDLTVSGDILPTNNLISTLGSPTKKFHSLYVGVGSVYLGDAKLSLEDGKLTSSVGFNLTGSVGEVSGAVQWDNVLGKPAFAAVATSGSYNDLTDKPTIPSIAGLATEQYVDDAVAAIVVPTDLSDLTDNTNLLQGTDFDQSLNTTDSPTFAGLTISPQTEEDGVDFGTADLSNVGTITTVNIVASEISTSGQDQYLYITSRRNDGNSTNVAYIDNGTGPNAIYYGVHDFSGATSLTLDKISVSSLDTNNTLFSNVLTEGADSVGSQIAFGRSSFAVQQFQDPEGDNNRLSSTLSLSGGEARLIASQETLDAENNPATELSSVTADIGRVYIETADINGPREWQFSSDGITFPDSTIQTTAYTGAAASLTADIDTSATVNTSETLTENNIFVNNNDFITDIDPELGFVIDGWSQRNETEIEINLFVPIPGDLSTFLIGLTVGRTVTVTYSTAGGDQVLTSVLSQEFSAVAQFDPVSGWGRVAGRIMGILPEDQTGIVSIDFPVVSTGSHTWTFAANGDLTAPGDVTTGLLGVGGRFIQDCEDGTTSMRWINVEQGNPTTQIIRAYTGDPKQDTELERAQILLNWQGEVEGSEAQSGITLKSFDQTDPDNRTEHDWQFQGTGNLVLPEGGDILDSQGNSVISGPVQPYLEVTNTPFITQPAVLGEPVTVTAAPAGSGATFDVVIGEGPVIESVTINSPGAGYVVGQNYNILYYAIGGTTTADNITIEVGTVGEGGEILTLAAYIGAGGNTPGTYTAVGELDYVPSVFDAIDVDLTLTRDNQLALFNSALENQYDNNTHLSPLGTEWNSDGWGDLLGLGARSYTTLRQALNNAVGANIVDAELVMHDTANDKYYKFDFSAWGQSNAGGFAYTRTEVTDPNYFRKNDGGDEIDIIVEDDGNGAGIGITRGANNSIYNPYREEGYVEEVSPAGTLWNVDGWDDLTDIETRTYSAFYAAYGGQLGNRVPGSKAVMYVPETGKYYAVDWISWTPNNNGGGFSYYRRELDLTKLNEGLRFADGTVLKSAEGIGRVKLESPGGRRIEEVHGYKQVSVTEKISTDYIGVSARTTSTNYEIFVTRTPELDAVLQPIWDNGGAEISISFDNITFTPSFLSSIQTEEYWFYYNNYNSYIPQTQGNNVYIRITTGGDPVVWWDAQELPSGNSNLRGAVIDYHAWTGESTIVGTVHIVRDSGEDHISHQEVASGSTDGENDDLWVVLSEGQVSYRRIDGEAKTLKVQWTAKVFYGLEFWD